MPCSFFNDLKYKFLGKKRLGGHLFLRHRLTRRLLDVWRLAYLIYTISIEKRLNVTEYCFNEQNVRSQTSWGWLNTFKTKPRNGGEKRRILSFVCGVVSVTETCNEIRYSVIAK